MNTQTAIDKLRSAREILRRPIPKSPTHTTLALDKERAKRAYLADRMLAALADHAEAGTDHAILIYGDDATQEFIDSEWIINNTDEIALASKLCQTGARIKFSDPSTEEN